MTTRITVLGAGPGGYVAAARAAQLGAEVTLIEKDQPGGVCLNWGCIPSKVLKTTAELLDKFGRAREFGVTVEGAVRVDMEALMARKKKVVDSQIKGLLGLFRHHKIRYLQGEGRAPGPGEALVETPGGKTETAPWDRLILATGTKPMEIPAFPFDGERILSSNDVLQLRETPGSILIVGGGVIGCEFAFILSALGSRVTVVEALDRLLPLPSVDADCSKILQREMKKRKIRFLVNRIVERVETSGDKIRAFIDRSPFSREAGGRAPGPETVTVDKALVCIGRSPCAADMDLSGLGVKMDDKGWIEADDKMKTSAEGVFAIGDALGPSRIMLAHAASREGLAAAENAMGGRRVMDYTTTPNAIFTMPEVADVGLTEAMAREEGREVRSDAVMFRTLGKAHVIGEIAGQAKVVSEVGTGKVLGVHIIGPHAADLIAEAGLAIQAGCTVTDLAETIHAHPTLPE
ncbi:MAG: dihydrolipoyl dehydrogenase, partial [Desulfobacterales bacterium]|nr:dihydrolipoyl dehydrogenase [Desulfobacterales bacterium]